MMVPQDPYWCGTTRRNWDKKSTIRFAMWGSPGVRLVDALRGNLDGLDDKNDFPFELWCNVVTIRLHVGFRYRLIAGNSPLTSPVYSFRGTALAPTSIRR